MSKKPVTILIVDDHPLFRQGVRFYLDTLPDISIRGEAENGDSAIEFLAREPVHVVLLDLQMPGDDGITVTRIISERWPEIKVLILTSFVSREKIFSALKAGAAGYIAKDAEPEKLVNAIHAVSSGGSYLDAQSTGELVKHLENKEEPFLKPKTVDSLSEREQEVLLLLAKGLSNREIAGQLFLGEATIKTHVANILQKLQVNSRTQAALVAIRKKMVE